MNPWNVFAPSQSAAAFFFLFFPFFFLPKRRRGRRRSHHSLHFALILRGAEVAPGDAQTHGPVASAEVTVPSVAGARGAAASNHSSLTLNVISPHQPRGDGPHWNSITASITTDALQPAASVVSKGAPLTRQSDVGRQTRHLGWIVAPPGRAIGRIGEEDGGGVGRQRCRLIHDYFAPASLRCSGWDWQWERLFFFPPEQKASTWSNQTSAPSRFGIGNVIIQTREPDQEHSGLLSFSPLLVCILIISKVTRHLGALQLLNGTVRTLRWQWVIFFLHNSRMQRSKTKRRPCGRLFSLVLFIENHLR